MFRLADGLTWRLGEQTRTETNLRDWLGERAQAGRLPPNGFPRSGRFSLISTVRSAFEHPASVNFPS